MRLRRPARSAVVVCALLLAASCSHDSKESQNSAMARMGLTLQQENELFGIAADPATIVIDTTNPNAPKDPNSGKFIGTSIIRATLKDVAGAPRPGLEVVFSTDAGTLASAGAPVLTNDQGIAQDTLTVDQDAPKAVHVTATSGEEHATVEVAVSVIVPNQPPVAVAGDDRTVECSAQAGTPVAVDGSASTDPDSTPGTRRRR
jgi:Big-like domain-containing protein